MGSWCNTSMLSKELKTVGGRVESVDDVTALVVVVHVVLKRMLQN